MSISHALTLGLDEGSDGHGEDGEKEADANALEVGDAGLGASKGSSEGEDEVVVERGKDDDEEDREDWERGWWEFERGDFGVHCRGLFDGESGELS